MIDWSSLAGNVLWILGCAAALATVSHAGWESSMRKEKLIAMLKLPAYLLALAGSAILFCLGMSWVAAGTTESVLWLLLAAAFTGYAGYLVFLIRTND